MLYIIIIPILVLIFFIVFRAVESSKDKISAKVVSNIENSKIGISSVKHDNASKSVQNSIEGAMKSLKVNDAHKNFEMKKLYDQLIRK